MGELTATVLKQAKYWQFFFKENICGKGHKFNTFDNKQENKGNSVIIQQNKCTIIKTFFEFQLTQY